MANYAEKLPKMLFSEELKEALTCLPEYDASIREADPGTKLLRLVPVVKTDAIIATGARLFSNDGPSWMQICSPR